MTKRRFAAFCTALVVCVPVLLLESPAEAGGLSLYEIATADVGLASAGWASRAQDPATLLKNPAGMSRLTGNQFQVGAQLLQAGIAFSPSAGTTVDGNSGGNPVGVLPSISLFYVHGLGEDVKVGLKDQDRTVTLPIGQQFRFGLGAEWQANPKLNVAFSYELAYGDDLPVNQNRGPLAGAVVGQFPSAYINFFQVSFIWGKGAGGAGSADGSG